MNEEEIRLDQTKKVFDTIATLIKKNETCSYRYLIYDLLGFKGKDYVTLLSGMALTNKLVECETQKEVLDKIKEIVNEAPCLWYVDEEIERVGGTIDLSYEEYTGWKNILKLLQEIE